VPIPPEWLFDRRSSHRCCEDIAAPLHPATPFTSNLFGASDAQHMTTRVSAGHPIRVILAVAVVRRSALVISLSRPAPENFRRRDDLNRGRKRGSPRESLGVRFGGHHVAGVARWGMLHE
jgi:hypothetical protein